MMNKTKLICAMLVASSASVCFGDVVNEATQIRQSSSGRIPLVSLTMPALQELSRSNKVARACFKLLSDPTVKLMREVEVMRSGQTMNGEFNSYMSERVGKMIGCAVSLAIRAEENSKLLAQSRPNKNRAIQQIQKNLEKNLEKDYENFKSSNQEIFDIPVLIAKGNNGYAKDYMAYNDIVIEVEDASISSGNSASSLRLKTLIDGGQNSAKEKGSTIREVIFDGVYSFTTNPMKVNTVCSKTVSGSKKLKSKQVDPKEEETATTFPCVEFYSVKYDGVTVDIRKSGQRWFDSEFIGGGVYAIELTGEKSTGTTIKIER